MCCGELICMVDDVGPDKRTEPRRHDEIRDSERVQTKQRNLACGGMRHHIGGNGRPNNRVHRLMLTQSHRRQISESVTVSQRQVISWIVGNPSLIELWKSCPLLGLNRKRDL